MPNVPVSNPQYDQMSSFSCKTGRYTSNAGDIIISHAGSLRIDDSSIKTEPSPTSVRPIFSEIQDNNQSALFQSQFGVSYAQSSSNWSEPSHLDSNCSSWHHSGMTPSRIETDSTVDPDDFGSQSSTITTRAAPTGVASIPVNAGHDDNHFDILLSRKNDPLNISSVDRRVQTGKLITLS